jgi:polysaccharide biosynthesis protein PslH
MNILFLSHRIPFPPNKGDKIRSYNELRHLSEKHSIYLGTTLDDTCEQAYVTDLNKYCKDICAVQYNRKMKLLKAAFSRKPFSISHFYDNTLQRFVDDVLETKRIDAVLCFCSSMAEYVYNTPRYKKNGLKGVKLIMDFVDLDSDKWLQYAKYARCPRNWIFALEHKRLFKYEMKINQDFDHSIFVSEREVKVFRRLYPEARNVEVVPNGVDHEKFTPALSSIASRFQEENGNPRLIFTGFMDYFANEDGVRWFCEKILPRIRAEIPKTELYIVGNRPTNMVWTLSEIDGVTVTGYVDDIRLYYWMADVCVIPLRIARGLQNKVLEAMATGNAVVATSNASDGIICHGNEDIVIADDEAAFAKAVIDLIKDSDKRRKIGRKAAENIRRYYSWNINLQGFDKLLDTQ